MKVRSSIAAGVLLASVACTSPPVDPEGTLERVRGGSMRVGITESDPWTIVADDGPSGIEVELVERFAEELDAEIEWFPGAEEELFGALKHGELDLVIGGFGSRNPYAVEAALTHPYLTTQVVVASPAGSEPPDDIAGIDVSVEEGTEAAGVLRKTDANVELVEDVTQVEGVRAIDDWLVDDLDLLETGVTLTETDHVMAVRLGENGWMVALERFLLDNSSLVHDLLDSEGGP